MLLQQSIEYMSIAYTCNTCNAFVHVIYSIVSGQYSSTILGIWIFILPTQTTGPEFQTCGHAKSGLYLILTIVEN